MCDNENMKRIGIFGGSFNPVHLEHKVIAEQAIKELKLDKLYVVPCLIAPHKIGVRYVDGAHRKVMLEIAFEGVDKVEISDFELNNKGTSYTYITVSHFKAMHENDELFFICGGDMLENFKTWRYPEKILGCCTLAAFDRLGFSVDYQKESKYFLEVFNKQFLKLTYQGKEFSSTRARIYLSLYLNEDGMLDEKVFDYIKKNNLYSGDAIMDFLKDNLTEKRRVHTAEVTLTALSKCKELGLCEEKVKTASLLHDCAKYLDYRNFEKFSLPIDVPKPVVHAFLGAFVAENVLGVKDEEILDAIKYHTSGKANMSLLGKLIFVADMIERGRDYQGVERLRELYNGDFEKCFRECLKEEMVHLINKKEPIYIETINAYEYYVKKEG